MCKPASFIITSSSILWCDSDSHEDIIKKYNLDDSTCNPNFVRVEITPPDNNYSIDISTWEYRVDQDFLPDWYNSENCERFAREELKSWAKHKMVKNVSNITVENFGKKTMVFINCKNVVVSGQTGGICRFHGKSTGTVSGQTGGDCWFHDNSKKI